MHELSLAEEVIRIAQIEAEKHNADSIDEITIEVGYLSGVDAGAFGSALEMLAGDTILAKAFISIVRTKGTGKCEACNLEFEMDRRIATCPKCESFPSEVKGGEEFRIVSITMECNEMIS